MKSIRLTNKEVDLLNLIRPHVEQQIPRSLITLDGLLDKIDKARNAVTSGKISIKDIEAIEQDLVTNYPHKFIKLGDSSFTGYARATRLADLTCNHSTLFHDMAVMGIWVNQQSWLKGRFSILDLLNKWVMWWPKAREWGVTVIGEDNVRKDTLTITNTESQATAPGRIKKGFR